MDSLSNKSKIIIGPIVTSWFFFIVNFVFLYHVFFFPNNLEAKIFIPLLLFIILEFTLSILVTISFEISKYYLYLGGVILCFLSNLILLIFLIVLCAKEKEWRFIIISLIEWIELPVLILYNKKVKASFNEAS